MARFWGVVVIIFSKHFKWTQSWKEKKKKTQLHLQIQFSLPTQLFLQIFIFYLIQGMLDIPWLDNFYLDSSFSINRSDIEICKCLVKNIDNYYGGRGVFWLERGLIYLSILYRVWQVNCHHIIFFILCMHVGCCWFCQLHSIVPSIGHHMWHILEIWKCCTA